MTEDSFIDFKCPHCGNTLSFPQEFAGLVQACPECAESVIVPADGSAVGRPLPLPIRTPRLVLRRLSASDWKDLLECLSEEELFRYVDGRPLGEEDILRWLEADQHVKLTTPNQPFCLGLQVQDGGLLIGYLSLSLTDPQRLQAEVQLFLGRRHQRQGFGTEAIAALLGFCFEGIALHRVAARSDSRNLAALRLCEKAGLRREGEFQQDRYANGEWANTVWHALLAEEYRARNSSARPDAPSAPQS